MALAWQTYRLLINLPNFSSCFCKFVLALFFLNVLEFLSQTKIPNLRDTLRPGWGDLWILTFQAWRIKCIWGKTAFSGIHTSCVKVFGNKFKASGVGGGGAGGGTPPPKILIWWKSEESPLKSRQNLCEFGQNVWKPSQNRFMCFDFTKIAPKIKVQTFLFFWRSCISVVFRASLRKFEQNPWHTQKYACSYTYERLWAFRACTDCKR